MIDVYEILIADAIGIFRPVADAITGTQLTSYFEDDIVSVEHSEWQSIEGLLFRNDD